jgi:hypothetical protein
VVAHNVTHKIRQVALARPHRCEPSVQGGGGIPNRLFQALFELGRQLVDQLDRLLVLGDASDYIAAPDIHIPFTVWGGGPAHFNVAQLLEIAARPQNMGAVDKTVSVKVIMAAQDYVNLLS